MGQSEGGTSTLQGSIAHTLSHSFIHYSQFRDGNQPTTRGLEEETGVPGGNPQISGRTCKNSLNTQVDSNPEM